MSQLKDGPASPLFQPVCLKGGSSLQGLELSQLSGGMAQAISSAPQGQLVCWGIPFEVGEVILLAGQEQGIRFDPVNARWLVFLHTSDFRPLEAHPGGFISPMPGEGRLNEHAAEYVIRYQDGMEHRVQIRSRHQIGAFTYRWGEECFQAVKGHKPHPLRAAHEQPNPDWSRSQVRVFVEDDNSWVNWIWAWENPHPDQLITGVRFEPHSGPILILGLTAGNTLEHPLRWQSRRKARLSLPQNVEFLPDLDEQGLLAQVQLDLGQVVSAAPQLSYPNGEWERSPLNCLPGVAKGEMLLEYTAHPEACFHLWNGRTIPVRQVEQGEPGPLLHPVPPAQKRVTLRVVESGSNRPVAVRLHVHGAHGEYLAPLDRHRILNTSWFEDYSVDFAHQDLHSCTYIPGETAIHLPFGEVFVEISKGFEIRPVRKVVEIKPDTQEITIEVDRVLHWRERGWVTADTHVHFLSPGSALLEGAAEGVNIVNLLASQWGELMTNVGDFDGRKTWSSRDAGGEEYLVRVGTENRQHVLGHISLLGYHGQIIAPMTTGGPNESALGDPIACLLTEWAEQCRRKGGLVVLPHFPHPRAEHAASIVSGQVDAVEMTSWGNLYGGIDPYSLSDWYRYLNCGYLQAAVGGTDKMSAGTAVGAVRTYAHLKEGQAFTYAAWMEAVRRAETFVTYGPLLEFFVDDRPMGSRISLPAAGGTLDVAWQAASVYFPMTRVELVVNGEIRESQAVDAQQAAGSWAVKAEKSSWIALLVRGRFPDQPEVIAAHSSPVVIDVPGSPLVAAADAITILEQIEGALAYIDTIGTRAENQAYKRMRLILVSAYRRLHQRMHQSGIFHDHDVQ